MPPQASPQRGARFDQRVLQVVALIPYGRVVTYSQVADWIGAFGCARQVGWALRRLALATSLPWHRVVNARGHVAMRLSREGSDWMQRELLIAEGIPVDVEGRLPLKRFLWMPPQPPGSAAPQDETVKHSGP